MRTLPLKEYVLNSLCARLTYEEDGSNVRSTLFTILPGDKIVYCILGAFSATVGVKIVLFL